MDKGVTFAVNASTFIPLKKIKDNLTLWFLVDHIEINPVINTSSELPRQNAFVMLMAKEAPAYLSKIEGKTMKDVLFNDLIEVTIELNMQFKRQDLKNAKLLITSATNCLWWIDINEEVTINASKIGKCQPLPSMFDPIYTKEYHQYREQKVSKPSLSSEKLTMCSDSLFDVISLWDRTKSPLMHFMNACRELATSVKSYSDYLVKCAGKMAENRQSLNQTRSIENSFSLPSPYEPTKTVIQKYSKLEVAVKSLEVFIPLCLDDDMVSVDIPKDRRRRYEWFRFIAVSTR